MLLQRWRQLGDWPLHLCKPLAAWQGRGLGHAEGSCWGELTAASELFSSLNATWAMGLASTLPERDRAGPGSAPASRAVP